MPAEPGWMCPAGHNTGTVPLPPLLAGQGPVKLWSLPCAEMIFLLDISSKLSQTGSRALNTVCMSEMMDSVQFCSARSPTKTIICYPSLLGQGNMHARECLLAIVVSLSKAFFYCISGCFSFQIFFPALHLYWLFSSCGFNKNRG